MSANSRMHAVAGPTSFDSHARYEHHGRPTPSSGDEGIVIADLRRLLSQSPQDGWVPHQEYFQTEKRAKRLSMASSLKSRCVNASVRAFSHMG